MSTLLKKLTFSFLSFLVLFYSIAPNFLIIRAQEKENQLTRDSDAEEVQIPPTGTWYNQDFWAWHEKVYSENISPSSEIFGERYTAAQVQWVVYGLISVILHSTGEKGTQALICLQGSEIASCSDKIKEAVESLTQGTQPDQLPSNASPVLAFFDAKPISGIGYVHEKINKFRLIPEVQAQGFGFAAGNPVQKLWAAFRDLSFGLIVIIALIMAFMIMFRVKISPQVVITLQSAIPKVIGALILITFSYAIAGFVIDLMYVVMGLLAAFLANSSISTQSAPEIFEALNNGNILSLTLLYLFYFIAGMASTFAGAAVGTDPNIVVVGGAATLGFVFGILIVVIALIVLFFAFFKILWLLLKTYVNVLIQIALAPIQILLGTITPFSGFGQWLKSLVSNLAVYPVVGFMYVLSFFFLAQGFSVLFPPSLFGSLGTWENIFTFPFAINAGVIGATTWSPPLTVGTSLSGILWLGVSLVIMTLIPKTAEIIQSAIAGKPFAYGTAIGESITGPFMSGLKLATFASDAGRAYTTRFGTKNVPGKPDAPRVVKLGETDS